MANSPRVIEAMGKVFDELDKLPEKELEALVEQHKDGEIARLILESGMLDVPKVEVETILESVK